MSEEKLALEVKVSTEEIEAVARDVLGADLDKIIALVKVCEDFIREQKIGCAETIHQCDWVIENAYSFIEDVCEVLGYCDEEDNSEESE